MRGAENPDFCAPGLAARARLGWARERPGGPLAAGVFCRLRAWRGCGGTGSGGVARVDAPGPARAGLDEGAGAGPGRDQKKARSASQSRCSLQPALPHSPAASASRSRWGLRR